MPMIPPNATETIVQLPTRKDVKVDTITAINKDERAIIKAE